MKSARDEPVTQLSVLPVDGCPVLSFPVQFPPGSLFVPLTAS